MYNMFMGQKINENVYLHYILPKLGKKEGGGGVEHRHGRRGGRGGRM
jgi:hypothetical protein